MAAMVVVARVSLQLDTVVQERKIEREFGIRAAHCVMNYLLSAYITSCLQLTIKIQVQIDVSASEVSYHRFSVV